MTLLVKKNMFESQIENLKKIVEEKLPKMKELVESSSADAVILHQDAFAGDYQEEEYLLLGMAIKYIGLSGKTIEIIGTNRDTIDKK